MYLALLLFAHGVCAANTQADLPRNTGRAPSATPANPRPPTPAPAQSEMEETMPTNEEATCQVRLGASGLAHRSETVLERERGRTAVAAHTLAGTSARGQELTTPPFSVAELVQALASDSVSLRQASAFLVGRCAVGDSETAKKLDMLVDERLRLETEPRVRVELAMSRALLGDPDGQARALLAALAKGAAEREEAPLAAGYLAQHGRAEGWPTLLQAFEPERSQATRVAALEAAIAFIPLQGARVGELRVDPEGLLTRAARDEVAGVRQAAILALVKTGHREAGPLLEEIRDSDPSPGVRAIAEHWLRHLEKDSAPSSPDRP